MFSSSKFFGIALLACAIFFGVNQNAIAGTAKPYCPHGVNHTRIDTSKDLTNPNRNPNGSWLETIRNVGDWGHSQCIDPGTFCVKGDTFTWWYNVEPPVEDGKTKGADMLGKVPDGWNRNLHDYKWVNN